MTPEQKVIRAQEILAGEGLGWFGGIGSPAKYAKIVSKKTCKTVAGVIVSTATAAAQAEMAPATGG